MFTCIEIFTYHVNHNSLIQTINLSQSKINNVNKLATL